MKLKGVFELEILDSQGNLISKQKSENVITNEGLNKWLNVVLHGDTPITTWYCVMFTDDYSPDGTETYAVPGFTEFTDYDEATRPAYVEAASTAKVTTNSASKAVYTCNASQTLYGVALVGGGTDSTVKSNTAGGGTLLCLSQFATAQPVAIGSVINLTYSISVVTGKWPGLGMFVLSTKDNTAGLSATFDDDMDVLVANGFTDVKIDNSVTGDTPGIAVSKSAVAIAVAKGLRVLWGLCWWPGATLTAAEWAGHRTAVLSAATWAQANGVYAFQIGNEEEYKIDGTTLTQAQLITNIKSLATDAQAIFTNGPITYSAYYTAVDEWITAGRGDIDKLCQNIYYGPIGTTQWQDDIDAGITGFGAANTWLTEFNLHASGLASHSADEAVQATAVDEMLTYIKASGITKAYFFLYYDDYRPFGPVGFGAQKTDGTYRQLWDVLLGG